MRFSLQMWSVRDEMDKDYHAEVGTPYLISPGLELETLSDVQRSADCLSRAAEAARPLGIKVGYHNHNREFDPLDGQYRLTLLANLTTPDVLLELDVFWAAYAGIDPIAFYDEWKHRIELIHIKQMSADRKNVDMPDGVLDYGAILAAMQGAGHFILERDTFGPDVWANLARDMEGLQASASRLPNRD